MSTSVSENHTADEDRAVVWFISFGDLLTLLVCLFLVITPWNKLNRASKSLNQRDGEFSAGSQQIGGIPFAASAIKHGYGQSSDTPSQGLVSEIPLWFPLRTPREGPWTEGMDEEVVHSVTEEVTGMVDPEQIRVTVRLCDRSVDRSRVLGAVHRALGRSEVKAASITVQLEGAQCDDVTVLRPVTQEILGTVRLERD